MGERRRYRTLVHDNIRWDGFRFRAGDIIISTPPKCGTTWMQTLCAYLVFGTSELDRPLAEISPWLDMQTTEIGKMLVTLEAQEHRRFIKTHTPLDGLPFDERATYICVGRDPRDVSLSWEHHMANLDLEAFLAARIAAAGADDLEELMPSLEPPPDDPVERFWLWANADPVPLEPGGVTLASILEHLATFWDRRDEPQIALFHYSDLLADLPGELRRLADVLDITMSDDRIAELAAAATFETMRERADVLAPDVPNRIWRSNRDFFHRGESGQWRHLLDDEGLRRYEKRVAELVPADLAAWAHGGRAS